MHDLDRRVRRGVAWVGAASSAIAVFDIVALAVILKYWISVRELGTVSIAIALLASVNLAAEIGLPAAIVQRDDDEPARLHTAYWAGLAAGVVFYGLIYVIAPLVADFYDEPNLTHVLRVLALTLAIRPLYTTHQALFRRELQFGSLSRVRIAAGVVELSVKIGSAAAGAGVWAFAFGPVARELVYATAVPALSHWKPALVFRARTVVRDLKFGMRATASELVYQLYANFDYQVVGYYFGSTSVGLYRAAKELVLEPVKFVSNVTTTVAFPTFSRVRHDREQVIARYVEFTRQNMFIVGALLGVVVIAAPQVLRLFLGEPYVVAADAARVLAVVGVFRAWSHLGPPLLDGLGRPDLTLRYHITAAVVLGSSFVVFGALGSSFDAVAAAWAVGYPIAFAVLATMVFAQLALPVRTYVRQVTRVRRGTPGSTR